MWPVKLRAHNHGWLRSRAPHRGVLGAAIGAGLLAMLPVMPAVLRVPFGGVLVAVFAGLMTYALTPLARHLAVTLGWLDYPTVRKVHTRPTALLGGLALYAGFTATLVMWLPVDPRVRGVVVGASLILLVGFLDDVRSLSAGGRLVWQVVGAVIMISQGAVFTFLPDTALGRVGEWGLSIIWIVGVTNALNFLDGLDGLAAGLAVVASGFFAVVAYQSGEGLLALVALALLGSCLGFLPHNFRCASIFLGDGGSNFLGAVLAGLALLVTWAEDNVVALVTPVLILGVPIFDTTFTTIMRVSKGQVRSLRTWLAFTGRDHVHHRLLALGLSSCGTVLFLYGVAGALGLGALVLHQARVLDAWLLLMQAGILFIVIGVLLVTRPRFRRARGGVPRIVEQPERWVGRRGERA